MTIRQLPPQVADAIAAGEVVERPASVVKELVENALDAGASRIAVDVRGAGRTLIRVADDGAGIPRHELVLAFRRHATSKVATVADLERIETLGFRGEALASIAAVAAVDCRSGGGLIKLRAGAVVALDSASPVPGTVIEVRDLFANTPARLRFLKSEATETGAVARVVTSFVLSYPNVRFELTSEDRRLVVTRGEGLEDAVRAALGVKNPNELLAVEFESDDGVSVMGVTSAPSLSRANRDGIFLSVNGRPVASRQLMYAIEECYRGSLERGRFPLTVLDIAIDGSRVDVNVHPTKREVRFREEGAVFGAVQRSLRTALARSLAAPYRIETRTPEPMREPATAIPLSRLAFVASATPAVATEEDPFAASGDVLRPLGQVQQGYVLAEGTEGLVLVDQHAAHERVLYNRFLARLRDGAVLSQPLLLAQPLEVGAGLVQVAERNGDTLRLIGFDVEVFGPHSIRILAGPAEMPAPRVGAACEEILALLEHGAAAQHLEELAASMACHSAVRFGDQLDASEQRELLRDLENAENALTCPHGRPTRLTLGWQDLKRHFRRNY